MAVPFVVVGIDGSDTSLRALAVAAEQAVQSGAELRIVSVVVPPMVSGYDFDRRTLDAMQVAARRTVDDAVAWLDEHRSGDRPPIKTIVEVGHVGTVIGRIADEDDGANMIVVGSRGLGGLRGMLLGSVTNYLAHHLTHPLLIVPAEEA